MSILSELTDLITALDIPVETGVFSDKPPESYIVITPMADVYGLYGDDEPLLDVPQVRLSLFCNGNYLAAKNRLIAALPAAGFTITERRYIGREDDTGYHHYSVDVEKEYLINKED